MASFRILSIALGLGFVVTSGAAEPTASNSQVVYPKETKIEFKGLQIEGEVRNPGEFYFQHRSQEKFEPLVKRRKNFHREMLRDAVLTR